MGGRVCAWGPEGGGWNEVGVEGNNRNQIINTQQTVADSLRNKSLEAAGKFSSPQLTFSADSYSVSVPPPWHRD